MAMQGIQKTVYGISLQLALGFQSAALHPPTAAPLGLAPESLTRTAAPLLSLLRLAPQTICELRHSGMSLHRLLTARLILLMNRKASPEVVAWSHWTLRAPCALQALPPPCPPQQTHQS